MQQVATSKNSDSPEIDLAFAKIAASAIARQESSTVDNYETISHLIKNPNVKKFTKASRIFVKKLTGAQVITEASSLPSTRDKVFFLRMWINENLKHVDGIEVSRSALDLIVSDVSYKPTAREFKDISATLAECEDTQKTKDLISLFEIHDASAMNTGPTVEYVSHRFHLIRAAINCRLNNYEKLIRDVESYINLINDIVTRITCISHFILFKYTIYSKNKIGSKGEIHAFANGKFLDQILALFDETADHDEVFVFSALRLAVQCPFTIAG